MILFFGFQMTKHTRLAKMCLIKLKIKNHRTARHQVVLTETALDIYFCFAAFSVLQCTILPIKLIIKFTVSLLKNISLLGIKLSKSCVLKKNGGHKNVKSLFYKI